MLQTRAVLRGPFVDQVRRIFDWKNHALQLATKLYGIEKAEQCWSCLGGQQCYTAAD